MAEIPSDISSSAAQAGYKAREVAKERDAHRSGQAKPVNRQVQVDDGIIVDTEDADTRVFTDAEGEGSQGRAFEEGGRSEEEEDSPPDQEGITEGEDGQLHLDLEA